MNDKAGHLNSCKISKDQSESIRFFLSHVSQFNKMSPTTLDAFMPLIKVVILGAGETLISQGDKDSCLYILYQGRLRLFLKKREFLSNPTIDHLSEDESGEVIGEVSPGEIVGEISFLINSPRSCTVRAIRDCVLLKIDHNDFQILKDEHPQCIVEMALTSITRLISNPSLEYKFNIATIAIAPAGDSNHIPFIQNFIKELNEIKPTILVDKELFCKHFNKDRRCVEISDTEHYEITAWIYSLEQKYGFVVFETDKQMTPWTSRCIREADKILLIAEANETSIPNSIETSIFSDKSKIVPSVDLVMIHANDVTKISGTPKWLKGRKLKGHHHLKLNSIPDYKKLVRFMSNRALGLVLNGGGARAFAHLGVLRALDELKIPIDYIGGSSMGALLGGLYALVGITDAIKIAEKHVLNEIKDVTLPLLSLLKGGYATYVYHDCFDACLFEDLWTRFFCVSTNLTTSQLKIHEQGLLWKAVRASTSLPAIYPPFCDENHHELVDGAVINNMPVDIMKKRIAGGKILAVNCYSVLSESRRTIPDDPSVSGWKLLFEHFNPFKKKESRETIYNILIDSVNLASNEHQRRMEWEADYLIKIDSSGYELLDFKSIKAICEIGYQSSMQQIPILFGEDNEGLHRFTNTVLL